MKDLPTRPKVLILSLADWFGSARLPYALREAGFEVGVAAEPGTLIAQSRSIDRFFPISVARVRIGMLSPLIGAIEVFDPLVIIPGDEAVVHLLYRLAQGEGPRPLSAQFAALIRRSVGDTARLKARTNRDQSRAAAAKAGILVPRNRVIASFADAEAFVAQIGWPVVLKREGTAGGHGVRICRDAEALAAGYRELEAMKLDTQSRSLKDRAHRLYWNLRSGFRLAGDLCREIRRRAEALSRRVHRRHSRLPHRRRRRRQYRRRVLGSGARVIPLGHRALQHRPVYRTSRDGGGGAPSRPGIRLHRLMRP